MNWLLWAMAARARQEAGETLSGLEESLLETVERVAARVFNETISEGNENEIS